MAKFWYNNVIPTTYYLRYIKKWFRKIDTCYILTILLCRLGMQYLANIGSRSYIAHIVMSSINSSRSSPTSRIFFTNVPSRNDRLCHTGNYSHKTPTSCRRILHDKMQAFISSIMGNVDSCSALLAFSSCA